MAIVLCPHCEASFSGGAKLKTHLGKHRCGVLLKGVEDPNVRAFAQHIDVAPPTKAQAKARTESCVYHGITSSIVIELTREKDLVTFMPYSAAGMYVERMASDEFDQIYTKVVDYPTGRAATLFVGFVQKLGSTSEALAALETLVRITDKEKDTAMKALEKNKTTRKVTKKVAAGKHGRVTVEKTATVRNSASAMFKSLIMAGKLTDDEIFAEIKKVFKLDDAKRSYVSWYRNNLTKTGHNPPPPKGGPAKRGPKVEKKTKKKTAKKATKKKVAKKKTAKKAKKK